MLEIKLYDIQDQNIKAQWIPPCFLLDHSEETQLPCCEDTQTTLWKDTCGQKKASSH